MKKVFIIIILVLGVYLFSIKEYNNSEGDIRFRVIANSNNKEDIVMKEKVVNELSSILFKEKASYEETNQNIYENLNKIETKIRNLFNKNNYDKVFNIRYGINEIPKKIYRGKTIPGGKYKSLVIEIGDAKGDNYFCFLYPSLCLIDYKELNENKEYGFKLLEILK